MNASTASVFAAGFIQDVPQAEKQATFNSDLSLWVNDGGAPLANWFTNFIKWIIKHTHISVTSTPGKKPVFNVGIDGKSESGSTVSVSTTHDVTVTTSTSQAGTSTTSYSTNC